MLIKTPRAVNKKLVVKVRANSLSDKPICISKGHQWLAHCHMQLTTIQLQHFLILLLLDALHLLVLMTLPSWVFMHLSTHVFHHLFGLIPLVLPPPFKYYCFWEFWILAFFSFYKCSINNPIHTHGSNHHLQTLF